MNEIPLDRKDLLKYEAGIFVMSLLTAGIFAWTSGAAVAVKLFLLFFLVPQPFILFAFKSVFSGLFRSKKGGD